MLLLFVVLCVVVAILFGALRIILGWTLPAATVKRFDAAVDATFKFTMKLIVVGLAGVILWLIWTATSL